MALADKPDERLRHEPGSCAGCGADLAEAPEVGIERRGGVRFAADDGAGQGAPAPRAPLRVGNDHVRYRAGGGPEGGRRG